MNVIGTCSLCGGAVCTPELWGGVLPPQPTCNRCGAVAANHGPIIPMRRVDKQQGPYVATGTAPEATYAMGECEQSAAEIARRLHEAPAENFSLGSFILRSQK